MAECPGLYVLTAAADGLLARVRLPGGRLGAPQARALAEAARALGNGVIEPTSRCNLQIRGLSAESGAALPRLLAATGLVHPPEVDRRRNILADALAGLDPDEVLDVSDLVAALDLALSSDSRLRDLSPKFSFALDGGGRSGTLALGHDAGLRMERVAGEVVCRVSIAGRPTAWAVPLAAAVPALLAVAQAVARLGPRARARDLVPAGDPGPALSAIVEAVGPLIPLPRSLSPSKARRDALSPPPPSWGRVREGVLAASPLAGAGGTDPLPTLPHEGGGCRGEGGAHGEWPLIGPFRQAGSRCVAFGLALSAGNLDADDLDGLADLADTYGDGTLRLTTGRGVLLPDVPAERTSDLDAAAEARGFLTRAPAVLVSACAGAACARGLSRAREDGAAIARALSGARPRGRPTVHVSACARGCAHPGAADVLALARPDGRYDLHRGAAASTQAPPLLCAVQPAHLAQAVHGLLAPTATLAVA